MPVTLSPSPQRTDPGESPPHKKWTREECDALEKAGLIELRQYELIEGELIAKMGKNLRHVRALALLIHWLVGRFGKRVAPEPAIDVSPQDNPTSNPEPDAVVLRRSVEELTDTIRPEDILLTAEVSDATLAFDLGAKAALYARAGIPEYWVLDVEGRRLIVHCDPTGGVYQSIIAFSEQEAVRTPLNGDATLQVNELL